MFLSCLSGSELDQNPSNTLIVKEKSRNHSENLNYDDQNKPLIYMARLSLQKIRVQNHGTGMSLPSCPKLAIPPHARGSIYTGFIGGMQ